MDWISLKNKQPDLKQEVLVFTQGYDNTGTTYWSHYELAIYDVDFDDLRKKAFYNPLHYRVKMFDLKDERDVKVIRWGLRRSLWHIKDITHWMPLPEAPSKIASPQTQGQVTK